MLSNLSSIVCRRCLRMKGATLSKDCDLIQETRPPRDKLPHMALRNISNAYLYNEKGLFNDITGFWHTCKCMTTSAEGNSRTIQTIHVTPPNPAASSPAESCPVLSQNTTATKPSTPAPSTSVLPSLLAPSSTTTSPTADPAKDQAKTALTMGSSVPKPQTIQLPQPTLQKVEDLFKVLDADSFLEPLYRDYYRCEIEEAVVCPTKREDVFAFLSPEQISALKKFLDKAIAHVGDKDSDLGKRLSDFRTECDIERDESQWYSSDTND
ncbi:hypothetical protein LAZ67_22001965 [Cordylochernes scorpioides]|uniref:Uncharacterized protein n=1 Tax=Cordylochernes scorpioides TaxID=51811 RepID=A0ABY6LQC1_9ARAC|nr:hypothetical protein LAZ67_22001965 [Cordylochernes scorpioides]